MAKIDFVRTKQILALPLGELAAKPTERVKYNCAEFSFSLYQTKSPIKVSLFKCGFFIAKKIK